MAGNGDKTLLQAKLEKAEAKLKELEQLKLEMSELGLEDKEIESKFNISDFSKEMKEYQDTIGKWVLAHDPREILGEWYPYFTFFDENRKISRTDYDAIIKALIDTKRFVHNINSMKEDETIIKGLNKNLNELSILEPFKGWINPKTIRYILGDLKCIDLVDRTEYLGWEVSYHDGTKRTITYNDLLLGWMIICRHFKMDYQSKLVSIESVRRDVTFNDILSVASIKGKVNYNNNPFIPTPLTDDCAFFFHDAYFNATRAEVINDWFTSLEM